MLPLVLAFVSAVALVAGWMHLQDTEASSASAPPVAPVVVPSASASGGSNGQSSATPAASSSVASQSPSSDAAAAESPSAVASAPVVPVAPSSAASPVVDRSVPVVVLNSTSRTGLAAKVASALRRDGWTVVSVGNYRGGRLAVTTVYADGHADAVATMRDDLRGGDRVRQPTGSMNPKRLTVVIGADYPAASPLAARCPRTVATVLPPPPAEPRATDKLVASQPRNPPDDRWHAAMGSPPRRYAGRADASVSGSGPPSSRGPGLPYSLPYSIRARSRRRASRPRSGPARLNSQTHPEGQRDTARRSPGNHRRHRTRTTRRCARPGEQVPTPSAARPVAREDEEKGLAMTVDSLPLDHPGCIAAVDAASVRPTALSVASAAPPTTSAPGYACDECFGPLEVGYELSPA